MSSEISGAVVWILLMVIFHVIQLVWKNPWLRDVQMKDESIGLDMISRFEYQVNVQPSNGNISCNTIDVEKSLA